MRLSRVSRSYIRIYNTGADRYITTTAKSSNMSTWKLPLFLQGEVVKGFGRGSKDLGCPTANFSLDVVKLLPRDFPPGVYCGWAQVNHGPVYKMVANVGWCPFYQNKEMSVETHVMHKFDSDFYGSHLKIAIVEYLRAEKNFSSLEELISAIQLDIENAGKQLERPEAQQLAKDRFFTPAISNNA